MQKSWESIVAMLAISQAGAAFVNVNPALKAAQVAYIAGDCDIRLLIADTDKLDALDPATRAPGLPPRSRAEATRIDGPRDHPRARRAGANAGR